MNVTARITRIRKTNSWCSINLYPTQNGERSNIAVTSRVRVSKHLDTSSICKKAKIMVHRWKTHCSSWAESVRSSTCRLTVRKKFEKVLLGNRWKRVPNWECLFVWEVGISAGGNTPHQATAQQMFPLALSTWKEECRSECRRSVEEKRWITRRKTEKDRTRKHDQTLIMDDIKMEWRPHTDTLVMECDAHQLWDVNCMRKMTCEVTLPVVTMNRCRL